MKKCREFLKENIMMNNRVSSLENSVEVWRIW